MWLNKLPSNLQTMKVQRLGIPDQSRPDAIVEAVYLLTGA